MTWPIIQELYYRISQAAEGTNHALNSTKDFHQVKILADSRWRLISKLPISYTGSYGILKVHEENIISSGSSCR
jgi:hypothetical protein